ncbi:MAG: hypothetical protein Q8J63_01885 [Candidatus Aquicultor sp.]|nr:hypothetical protein [Candidatus Aquicultor sp.]
MKCASKKPEPKVCKTCGFKTEDLLILVCPRCMNPLPGHATCSGGCGSCSTGK